MASLQSLFSTPAAATAALAAAGITVSGLSTLDGQVINLSNFPLCLCENFRNDLTTDYQGQHGCARSEVHGLSGVEKACAHPERPYIPQLDSGCDVGWYRCVVTYQPPTFPSCTCHTFIGGRDSGNGMCQKKGSGECYPRNYEGDKKIGNEEFYACAEDM